MAISQNFPSSRPSLNLNFARSKTLDPRITFTRTSAGTYVDESGIIRTASADQPRFDHNPTTGESLGLLVEESRTNLSPYSETLDNWIANGVNIPAITVTPNAAVAPNGTLTADVLSQSIDAGSSRWIASLSNYTYTSGVTYTLSIWLKKISGTDAQPRIALWVNEFTDQSVGTLTTEWVRYSATFTASSTSNNTNFTGLTVGWDNNGAANNFTFAAWGFQLEIGAFPTSYIPTTTATVTRSQDNASMTGTNFSSWYNQSEGTFVLDCTPIYNNSTDEYRRLLSIHNNSGQQNDVIQFIQIEASNQVACAVWDESSFQSGFNKVVPSGTRHKVAFAVKENNMNASYDGNISTDDTSATLPTMTRMDIGTYLENSNSQTTVHFNNLMYYPTRLPNDQLQTLTK